MNVLRMGFKSLLYRKKQYISLFLVCMVGIGFSLYCFFLIQGMLSALEDKAKIYYGGNLTFIGGKNGLSLNNAEEILNKVSSVFPEGTIVSKRFDLDADYAAYYFEGTGVRQRVIKGVDFEKEKELFKGFNYVAGSADQIAKTNGVLLSFPIAQMLGVKVDDVITLMLKNNRGYINTVELVVKGIFKDSSLFGMYTSYMDISHLRSVYGFPQTWANRICVKTSSDLTQKEIEVYQSKLEAIFNMFPLVEDKQIFYNQLLNNKFDKNTYALIKLNANLQDLQILITAMKIIASFIIFTLLVIIIVGVSSTYRVIAMKRINEIGIYMAIGMKRKGILGIMMAETLILLVGGCICGFIFSLFLSWISGFLNLSFIPAFDIFLVNGLLKPIVSIKVFFIISIVICVTTVLAVLFAVYKAVKIMPAIALGVTE